MSNSQVREQLIVTLFQRWLSDDCVVVDTETTGLGNDDEIVEIMGAFDCYVYNVQDPTADHVAYKPKLAQAINDGNLFDVILEAYAESQETIEALKSGMEAMTTIYDAQKVRIGELEARTLSVKLPDPSSKAFWGGTGKDETFYPSTYKRWVAEAIEQAGTIAQVAIEVK